METFGTRITQGNSRESASCAISPSRLMMRQVENYEPWADELIEQHGEDMAQLLGRRDFLSTTGVDYSRVTETFNNAKR